MKAFQAEVVAHINAALFTGMRGDGRADMDNGREWTHAARKRDRARPTSRSAAQGKISRLMRRERIKT